MKDGMIEAAGGREIIEGGYEKKWEYDLIGFSEAIQSKLYHSSVKVCTLSLYCTY